MSRFRKSAFLLLASAVALGGAARPPVDAADLILTNARVYTVEPGQPWAQAVAIKGGKIVAIGSSAEISKRKGAATRIVDLHGKLLMPAFGDAHNHPIFGGMSFARCSLHAGRSVADYRRIIEGCIAANPGTGAIFGVGWEDGLFPPNGVPRKEVLDAISTTRPLIFGNVGGHSLWVNSKALELAGITKDTPDPKNGQIDRDPQTREPIGGLQESAQALVDKLVPPPSAADMAGAVAYTVRHFNSLGITSWHDAGIEWAKDGSSSVLDAYKAVQAKGELSVHVALDIKWDNARGIDQIPDILRVSETAKAMGFTARSVKYYLDGVIPQQTAAMIAPYEGTSVKGTTQIPADTLAQAITAMDKNGFQPHLHAIGDGAVREALDAIGAARKANGKSDMRPMISHLNVIDPADQPRFGQLGVAAIFQPLWACDEPYMRLTMERIGPVRSTYIYPDNSVLKGGGMLAYGADWSVASANPLLGLQVALTRVAPETPDLKPLNAGEAVTLAQAVQAYTLNVAYVNHLDAVTGSIKVGKQADLIVLDHNIFDIPATDIGKTKVLVTLFGGREVFGALKGL